MTINNFVRTFVHPMLATVMAVSSVWANGQDLHKVEVIIFERNDPPSGSQERWPRNIELSYPADTQLLVEPPSTPEAEGNPSMGPVATTPYQMLPASEFTLTARKNALGRNHRLRTLYHQAWLQPLVGPRQSRPVLIAGGETFGQHQELGGTIEISVNKFIHVDAKLWLVEFEQNAGQVPELWPPLPTLNESGPENLYSASGQTRFATSTNNDDLASASSGFGTDLAAETSPSGADDSGSSNATWAAPSDEPFLVKEIVTLEQSRRMRSNELHYLDHPKLGILVQVEKYQASKGGR